MFQSNQNNFTYYFFLGDGPNNWSNNEDFDLKFTISEIMMNEKLQHNSISMTFSISMYTSNLFYHPSRNKFNYQYFFNGGFKNI